MNTPNNFNPEAATRPTRIEFVREGERGVTPEDPEWSLYSNNVINWWGWEPEAAKEAEQGHGEMDPHFTPPGPEDHEVSIEYKFNQWLVDGSGNALDPAADCMILSDDNSWENTHSAVSRMESYTNGADGAGYRVYHVGRGGCPSEVELPFEPEDGSAITVALDYIFEKVRPFRIDQPASPLIPDVVNNGTSEVEVTIEDEGAETSETISVAAGSTSSTTAEFGDFDAFALTDDVDGTVELTDGNGTTYSTITGSDEYTGEGDLGVPPLGSGSHADALPDEEISFIGTEYGYDTGDIAAEIVSGSLTMSLETETNAQHEGARKNIHTSGRRTTWGATVAGASETVDHVAAFLTGATHDVVWDAGVGTITGPDAEHMTAGESEFEAGNSKHQRELEIQSVGLDITAGGD